ERVGARHRHHQSIKAEGDAAVRWCAISERLQQKAETLAGFLVADAEGPEHPRLQVGEVDANRSAAELESVEDHVVCTSQHRSGITFQLVGMRRGRRREGMMSRKKTLRLFVPLEQR